MRTDFAKLDAVYPLPCEELFKQWVVARDCAQLPAEWKHESLMGWTLAAHPAACVLPLVSSDERQLGWVMEPLVQMDARGARIARDAIRLSADHRSATIERIERELFGRDPQGHPDGTGIEGMWIAVVVTPQGARVYPGPIHSVVYDAAKRRVATSPNLLAPLERDRELSAAFDPLASEAFFSFGLTAFRGVHRLLPNHYLDLATFEPVRHWPKSPLPARSAEEAARAVVDHSRRIIAALAEDADEIHVPLSAGNDSRAILSLLRPMVGSGAARVTIHTTKGPTLDRRIDLQGARKVAAIAGLPLEERARIEPEAVPEHLVMRNFARIGEAKAGRALYKPTSLGKEAAQPAETRRVVLAGMGAETARAGYWKGGLPDRLDADEMLRIVGAPAIPQARQAACEWLESLPGFLRANPAGILDLAHVEQRLGCWEANSRYLNARPDRVVSPMTSGFCIAAMLSIPEECRASGTFQQTMIAQAWPELLEVPINRGSGMLRIEQEVRRVLGPIKRGAVKRASRIAGVSLG